MRAWACGRLGFDFVTLGWETYYFAASRSLDAPVLERLIAAIRERAESSSGYRAAAAA